MHSSKTFGKVCRYCGRVKENHAVSQGIFRTFRAGRKVNPPAESCAGLPGAAERGTDHDPPAGGGCVAG